LSAEQLRGRHRFIRLLVEQLESRSMLSAPSASPIQHIFYVVKENRTYDQVFGSLSQGNGDPSLNLFGDESAPNQRALQQTFLTLDNFYADAEVSADGWNWLTGGLANTYVQRAQPQDYSNGNRNRPYDFEGGNFATSPGPNPQDAFIWDKLSDAGISYRNYGFRVFGGQVASTEPLLAANTDLNFAGFNLSKPDSIPDLIVTGVNQPTRIGEWLKEFNNYVTTGTLPTVEFVRLPSDHNAGTFNGAPTPRAYMADNDYALGQLVDAVSHSPYWKSSLILVTEDDAQDGPDHVDGHRTIGQVISPYTQTGEVDSTFYSTVSMLRTIEQIVGISPMTQFDAAANSFVGAFTKHPNFAPYSAIVPTQNVHEKNPVSNPLAPSVLISQLQTGQFAKEDLEDSGDLNQQIWESIKGDTPMPPPVNGFRNLLGPQFGPPGNQGGDQGGDQGDDQGGDTIHAGPQGDGTGITTQGWDLTPVGQQVTLGDRPMGIALSPDGKTILVSNDGSSNIESLMVIDRATGNVVQTINYQAPEALWIGLTFSPDGTHAYASAGGDNKIRVYDVSGQQLTETAPIMLPLPVVNGKKINLFPAGLSVSPDGNTLYVADNLGDRMSVIDLTAGTVTATISVGHNPYTTLVSKDGKTVYVSNWGGTTISVVDVSGATPTVTQTVQVGTHPTALLLNPMNNELYVANADSDTISVLDTTTNQVIRTIDLTPFPGAPFGAGPSSLAISSDGKTLYVGNNFDNDIAVVRLASKHRPDHLQGLIPTGWIPAGVVLSPDDLQLAVINSKGLGAGPNVQGPNPYLDPESTDAQYVGSMIVGTLSLIDVPDKGDLRQYTEQVVKNDHFFGALLPDSEGEGGSQGDSGPDLAFGKPAANSVLRPLGRDAGTALTGLVNAQLGGTIQITPTASGSLVENTSHAPTEPSGLVLVGHQATGQKSGSSSTLAAHLQASKTVWDHPDLGGFDGDETL
jgi:YVTN family beta-propeller protein